MIRLLQDTVARQARRRPDSPAVVMGEERLTYGELEAESNRLARLLREAGCVPGDRICLFVPKCPAAIVGMLATLKARCAYVPIDIASPAPRVAKIVESAEPRLILAMSEAATLLDEVVAQVEIDATPVGSLEREALAGERFASSFSREDAGRYPADAVESGGAPDDIAHLLFTSGSTGTPKGVMITHANVAHFIGWATTYFGTDESDRISGHPPLHFDLSTFDIYGTFLAGAELHLVPAAANLVPHKLADLIRDSELTQWFAVPSIFTYMAKFDVVAHGDFPSLKRVLWCGEVLPTPILVHWMERLPHATFTNLYGPTEATIASSYYTVPELPAGDTDPIPIGVPCAGEELLILDEDMREVPPGEIGDLYLAGVGLSPGYWRDEEKTAAAFVRDPRSDDAEARIYRTGDLARWGADGLVYFLGRADSQIKHRGYRIELGEIETALNALGDVRECAVVGVDTGGFEGTAICCAYAPAVGQSVAPPALSEELRKVLPAYMLPSRWLSLEGLPKNVNGKIDRRTLKELFAENGA
jgi:amino acid adenylation domain-containing protein